MEMKRLAFTVHLDLDGIDTPCDLVLDIPAIDVPEEQTSVKITGTVSAAVVRAFYAQVCAESAVAEAETILTDGRNGGE